MRNRSKKWNKFKAAQILELHRRGCSCSYCEKPVWGAAIWLPRCKAANSWRILALNFILFRVYLRTTLPQRPPRVRWYIDTASIDDFLPPKGPERDAFEKDLQDRMAANASRDTKLHYAGTCINPNYYARVTVTP